MKTLQPPTLLYTTYACVFLSFQIACNAENPAQHATEKLASMLVQESDMDGAAIEYRRLSLFPNTAPSTQNNYRWLSAYYYLQNEQADIAVKLLDTVQDPTQEINWKSDLLRAYAAEKSTNTGEEIFYLQSIASSAKLTSTESDYITRKLAVALVKEGRNEEAKSILNPSTQYAKELKSLQQYESHQDKNTTLGGWLGLVPGLGYAYAGEYANATRSLILNSLFIFGMAHAASNDEWGAFAAISFFEITWYTGSIYGGIDASHRYNYNRKNNVLNGLSGGILMQPDASKIPAISLKFTF